MSGSKIAKHYARIIVQWPKDPLRPGVSFQSALQSRASKPVADEKAETRNVTALYSLLDNQYKKKYPISSELMRPASNPTYYDDLIKELQEAPQRSWFGRQVNKWRGFLRFS